MKYALAALATLLAYGLCFMPIALAKPGYTTESRMLADTLSEAVIYLRDNFDLHRDLAFHGMMIMILAGSIWALLALPLAILTAGSSGRWPAMACSFAALLGLGGLIFILLLDNASFTWGGGTKRNFSIWFYILISHGLAGSGLWAWRAWRAA